MPDVYIDYIDYLQRLLQRIAVEEGLPLPKAADIKDHSAMVWWLSPTPDTKCIRVEIDTTFRREAVLAYWYAPFYAVYRTPFIPGALPEGKTLEDLCREACRAVKEELKRIAVPSVYRCRDPFCEVCCGK